MFLSAIVLASLMLYAVPAAFWAQHAANTHDSTMTGASALPASAYAAILSHMTSLTIDSAKFTHFTNSGYVTRLDSYGAYITVNDTSKATSETTKISTYKGLLFSGSCTDSGFADTYAYGASSTPPQSDDEYYVDQPQTIAINDIWTNSNCSPFTANVYFTPSPLCNSGDLTPANLIQSVSNINGLAPNNAYLFNINSNGISTGLYGLCTSAEDSNGLVAVGAIYKTGIQVSNVLVLGTPTASNAVVGAGTDSVITTHASGGTTQTPLGGAIPYKYNWYSVLGSNAPTCNANNQSIIGSESNTLTAYPAATTTYAYQVIDGATFPTLGCSPGVTITVNSVASTVPSAVPANVLYYLPITLYNYQSAPVAPNTPLMIGVTSSSAASIVGFPVSTYARYFSANLVNYEFFDAGGNVLPSYMEGNYINELTWNGYATSASSANAPIKSANVIFWVTSPYWNDYLGSAANRTPTTETIYLGWAGNYVGNAGAIAANFLMGGKNANGNMMTGEAPQLSCPVASATANCATYAAFDNGNYLFGLGGGFEANFSGSSYTQLPSWLGYTTSNTQETTANYLQVSNGITLTVKGCSPACNDTIYSKIQAGSTGTPITSELLEGNQGLATYYLGEANPGTYNSLPYIDTSNYVYDSASTSYTVTLTTSTANELLYLPITEGAAGAITVSSSPSLSWGTSKSLISFTGFGMTSKYAIAPTAGTYVITVGLSGGSDEPSSVEGLAIANVNTITPFDPDLPIGAAESSSVNTYTSSSFSTANANDMIIFDNGYKTAQGTVTVGSVGSATPVPVNSPASAASATVVEYANVIATQNGITASMTNSGGAKGGWIVDAVEGYVPASPTPALGVANSLLAPSYIISWAGNSWKITYTKTGKINNLNQSGSSLSPAPPSVIGITWSNATNLYSSSGTTANNIVFVNGYYNSTSWDNTTIIARSGPIFAFLSGSGGASATKTGTIQWFRARLSPPNDILPSTAYGAVAQSTCELSISSPTNSIADVGQYESVTANEVFCVPNYNYKLYSVNSITPSKVTNTIISASTPSTSYTTTWYLGANAPSNSPLETNVVITDSGANVVSSNYSSTYTVNPALSQVSLSLTNAILEAGQFSTLSATMTGGSAPYTYNFIISNSVTGAPINSVATLGTRYALFLGLAGESLNNVATSPFYGTQGFLTAVNTVNNGGTNSWGTGIVYKVNSTSTTKAYATNGNGYGVPWIMLGDALLQAQSQKIAIDGTNSVIFSDTNSNSVSITTANSPDVIIVAVGSEGASLGEVSSVSDTNALSWSKRSSTVYYPDPAGGYDEEEIWYAIASGTLSHDKITVTLGNTIDDGAIMVMGVSGAATASPWSSNALLPANSLGLTAVANVTVPQTASTGNTTLLYLPSWLVGNTLQANVVVTDSASVPTTNTSAYVPLGFNSPLSSSVSMSASNTPGVDAGQYEAFAASWSAGTSPYTANYQIVNSITNAIVASYVYTGISGTSNTLLWQVPAASAGNTVLANVIITDSASTSATANSIQTSTIAISSAPSVSIFASNAPSIDANQYETLTATESGGTYPYTYNFLVYNSVTNAIIANDLTTSPTYTFLVPSYWSTNSLFYANVFVTDNAATPVTANSALTSKIAVSSPLASVTWSASNGIVDSGQTQTLSATWTGGTGPYTANYLVYNSFGSLCRNTVYSGMPSTSNSYSYATAATGCGVSPPFTANIIITDSAGSNEMVSNSLTYVLNKALSAPTISVTNSLVDAGQYTSVTPSVSGGSSPWVVNVIISNSITGSPINTITQTSSSPSASLVYMPSWITGNTIQANVVVTDSATTNEVLASGYTPLGFNALPVAGIPTESNTVINSGQYSRLTAAPSLGTQPYSYQWYTIAGSTAPTCTSANAISGATSSTYLASPTTTNSYAYLLTDSATSPSSACSYSNTIAVNPSLSITLLPAANTITTGQSVTFTNMTTGGTSPYTYSYSIFQYGTAAQTGNYLITGNSIEFLNTGSSSAQTFNVLETVTDHTGAIASSSNSVITVDPTLLITLAPTTNTVTTGSSVRFVNTTIGGTPPYTYSYSVFQYGTAAQPGNYVITGNSIEFLNTGSVSAQTFNVIETVTDHNGVASSSSNSVITVNPAPVIILAPSTNTITSGVYQAFTNTTSGGTPPYTYSYSIFQYGVAAQSGNYIISGNTIKFLNTGSSSAQTFNVLEAVIDSSGVTGYSSNSVITANPTPSITLSPTANAITTGQSVRFTNSTTGGTSPYTYSYSIFQYGTAAQPGNYVITGNSIEFLNTGSSSAQTFNVLETVTDHSGVTAFSSNSAITVNPPLLITISPAANTITTGSSVKFTNTTSGGTPPYTYSYSIFQYGVAAQSGNYMITGNSIEFLNTGSSSAQTFNVIETVTDHTGSVAYSSNSVINVNPALSITISPAANTITTGQSVRFTNTTQGGTSPYTYSYSVFQYGTAAQTGNYVITENSIEFLNTESSSAQTFNVLETVTDNIGTVAHSSNSVITVNPSLSITISPAASTINTGSSVVFTNTTSGGTSPYTYSYLVFQYGTAAQTGNYLITGNSIEFLNTESSSAQTFNVIETVIDYTGFTAYSSNSVITVNPALSITISPAANTITTGQSVKFTNVTSGGTSPYTYSYSVFQYGVTAQDANYVITGNSIEFPNAGTFNVLETATDFHGLTASSANSVVTVNPVSMLTISILPTSQSINVNQTVAFTNTTTGGTPPYTFSYLVFQYGTSAQDANYLITGNSIKFTSAGTYNVLENVVDNLGATANSANSVITASVPNSNVIVNTIVTIPPGGMSYTTLNSVGALTLHSNATANVVANVLVVLVTANYSSTPISQNYTFSKLVIINATITSSNAMNISKNLTLSCSSYGGCQGLAPYLLSGSVWTALQPYYVNETAQTINVTIPGDPIVGLFRETPITTTTTISSGGGGGTVIQGSGGTGVPAPQPVISKSNNTYTISDLAQANKISLDINNTHLEVVGGAVNKNSTTIYISGTQYTLYPNSSVAINGSLLYVKLVNTTYPKLGRRSVSLFFGVAGQPSPTQLFGLNYLPSFTSINNNQGTQLQLNIKNIYNEPEEISFNAPNAFPGSIAFSANTIYLEQNKSVTVSLQFNPDAGVPPGLYYVPVTITSTTVGGVNNKETQFLAFRIKNTTSSTPYASTQITLINDSQTISGVIQVYGYPDRNLTNTTLITTLPSSIVANISDIKTYGLQNNITVVNGTYVINWDVSYIPKGNSAYAYFTVQRPISTASVVFIQNKLIPFAPSQKPANSSDVSILSIYLPTFYTNSTGSVNVRALYRNATSGLVTFTLTGPSGIVIQNATQTVNASLGQTLNRSFGIVSGPNIGTLILELHVSAKGANLEQNLPIVIISNPKYTIGISNVSSISQSLVKGIEDAAVIIVIITAVGYAAYKVIGKRRKSRDIENIKKVRSEMMGENDQPTSKKGNKK